MADQTPKLKLDYMYASQAEKHVTFNQSLSMLDAVFQSVALSASTPTPPTNPSEGDLYLIPQAALADWGQIPQGNMAAFINGAWRYLTPSLGSRIYVCDEDAVLIWQGSKWRRLSFADASVGTAIHNGLFRVWQRGTTFPPSPTCTFVCDRWAVHQQAPARFTTSRGLGMMTKGDCSLRLTRSSSGPFGKTSLIQVIAFHEVGRLAGGYVVASLSLRTSAGLEMSGVALKLIGGTNPENGAVQLSAGQWANQSSLAVGPATQTSSTTYDMKVVAEIPPTIRALALVLEIDPAANFPADSWIEVGLAQLEQGKTPSLTLWRPLEVDLTICQAYFEKSYDLAVIPGTQSDQGRLGFYQSSTNFVSNGRMRCSFRTAKVRTPSVKLYSPSTGTSGCVGDVGGVNRSATAIHAGETGFELQYTDPVSSSGIWWHFTADAEI
jgi:hypothetical protein